MIPLLISGVRSKRAGKADARRGLEGWISFLVNDAIRIDGATLRRSADGKLFLAFPERRDSRGNAHALAYPVTDEARREIERQVFALLKSEGWE